jgi:hypothetical protein
MPVSSEKHDHADYADYLESRYDVHKLFHYI